MADRKSQFDIINRQYGVAARRGLRVTAYGKPGTITSARGAYLMIRVDGAKRPRPHHPTDQIVYGEPS